MMVDDSDGSTKTQMIRTNSKEIWQTRQKILRKMKKTTTTTTYVQESPPLKLIDKTMRDVHSQSVLDGTECKYSEVDFQ